jgi:uncharacterized protein YidB (DUF937 family)
VTVAASGADARVPGYLGRVLDGGGAPVGTCFQVAQGVLVTAWHVLDHIGAAEANARVRIDPLAGGAAFDAAVACLDDEHDLAVLTSAGGLPAVTGPLTATDQVPLRVTVTVTGHAVPDDPGHLYRFLNAPGEWAGGTIRDEVVRLGRMTSSAVVRGMSGGPVICDSDGAVAGVVSGRYNSGDGWLADTVWVARTEDLAVLLGGIAEVPMRQAAARALPGRPLEEVGDPFALEVHRPVQPDDPPPGLPELPAYVPRDHDTALGSVVRAAEGRSGIAVLVGGSSTGKTRACWEALQLLRDRPEPWRLWHPIDPTRPEAALRELPIIGPRTVVWLNEAQLYLGAADGKLGERVAAGLRELLRDPARAPVLVLATLWPQYWHGLTARPAGAAEDPHAQARELLAGHDIAVPAAFTRAQLLRLSEAGDARLTQAASAAQDGQVIQFLAGIPELLARYRHAPPAAAALINAAMDARRLGMGIGLPWAFLRAAAPSYLTDAEWGALDEDWLEQALAYTAEECKGVRGPLTRIYPRPARSRSTASFSRDSGEQPLYRLADYLDQYGRNHRKGQVPPSGLWAAAADHAFPGDQVTLGATAHDRGLYRDAAQLYKNAAARGNLDAVFYLSRPPGYLRSDVRPLRWAASHVSLDDLYRVAVLLDGLREAGAREQVTLLADRAAAHVALDDPGGITTLLRSLREAGAEEQVTVLADRAAAHVSLDSPAFVAVLLDGLREAGAREQVTALAARAAAQASLNHPSSVTRLLHSLREAGAEEQVTALLRRDPAAHASLDNPDGVVYLLGSLREAGAEEQVTALADRAAAQASLDNPDGVARLLDRLRAVGAEEQVTALADRAAAHASLDDLVAVARLLDRLRAVGAEEQVTALADRAAAQASVDDPTAVVYLLDGLRAVGAEEQVTALADRAAAQASLNHPARVAVLLDGLRALGAGEQVTALADRAAAHASLDDPYRVAALLGSLQEASAEEQVTALLHRDPATHVSLDDAGDVAALLDRLRAVGAEEQVTALADRAAAHAFLNGPAATAWLLDRLRAVGAEEQVTALAGQAAAHASLDDPGGVAALLDSLREAGAEEQVTALLHRDPAAHVSLDDPGGVADLLDSLQEASAEEQVTALLHRDPAAHVSLDDPGGVAALLDGLRAAGAEEQVTVLADRAAARASLDDPDGVADLLDSLREAGAREHVTALAGRLPAAGMFELFEEQEDRQDRFRFGRENDGSPAEPWGWGDLD